jgi:excinuclease ABC subunit C
MKTDYKAFPNLSGVYFFKDAEGTVLYIGKAASLKKRVASYFQKTTDWKVQALLETAETIEFITTTTETEALLLEAELVQKYHPKFNVLLKTGQPFLYLLITKTDLPQLEIVRNKKKKGFYFGPFIHKQQARSVHRFLIERFQLLQCNKKIENGCLDFHLGKCAGTCMSKFKTTDYLFKIELVQDLLKKDHKKFLKRLDAKIKEYTDALEFEKARNLVGYKDDMQIIFDTLATRYSDKKYAADAAVATLPVKGIEDYQKTAIELKKLLNLSGLPETIDCFDISHFQSRSIVGSCVRFTNGKPDKNKFRRFKIKSLIEQNDYAALHEIVARRYKNTDELPDLVLIDGGKGQRNAVLPLLQNTTCISLAKREETIFSDNHPEGIKLSLHSEAGKLLIALRDYAHHFAITYHRLTRKKDQ